MKLKFTKEDFPIYCETIFNCILSCENHEQLKVAEEMIYYFVVQRFNGLMPIADITCAELYLSGKIEEQAYKINTAMEYPTLERYLN